MAPSLIVLTTDFGLSDSYVGVMKGVIASIAPEAKVIDLTHDIRPQDIRHGAYVLKISTNYFPDNTLFVTVVDPGVGSSRKKIAVRTDRHYFIAPDNGVLTHILNEHPVTEAISLTNSDFHLGKISSTFHGRDIFSPVAAHLANGVSLSAVGSPMKAHELVKLPAPKHHLDNSGAWHGEVIHIDRFGNLITTLTEDDLSGEKLSWHIQIPNAPPLYLEGTYADVKVGEPVAYIGSDGFVEIGVRNSSAEKQFSAWVGMEITARKE